MARTTPQLRQLSAIRIREQNRRDLTWIGMLRALNRAPVPNRELIIAAVKAGDIKTLGTLIITQINRVHQTDANAEATTIFSDNNISVAELDRIL